MDVNMSLLSQWIDTIINSQDAVGPVTTADYHKGVTQ